MVVHRAADGGNVTIQIDPDFEFEQVRLERFLLQYTYISTHKKNKDNESFNYILSYWII